MASYSSLPTNPIERKAIAKIPANKPGPKIDTSNNAQINELIEREATIHSNANGRRIRRDGVVLLAARNANGTAITMPNKVPRVAMLMVSHSGFHKRFMYSQRGGKARSNKSAAAVGASYTNTHMVFSVITFQHHTNRATKNIQNTHNNRRVFGVR